MSQMVKHSKSVETIVGVVGVGVVGVGVDLEVLLRHQQDFQIRRRRCQTFLTG